MAKNLITNDQEHIQEENSLYFHVFQQFYANDRNACNSVQKNPFLAIFCTCKIAISIKLYQKILLDIKYMAAD